MGSSNGLPHAPEGPEHSVRVADFWMADTLVTREQFLAVMNYDPSHFNSVPDLPVESVRWDKAREFCRKLSVQSGEALRLPSEAEWEYACRAGSTTQYFFGDSAAQLGAYAWFELNSRGQTAPVRQKQPNPWGLYDMTGNVWEWCLDVWHADYNSAPSDGSPWLDAANGPRRHCVRGGAWDMDSFRCRSSYRSYDWEEIGTSRTGFRVIAG
jgi:formylglycine-generating enzyme required for sulfatase activity